MSTLVRWEPFRELGTLQSELSRLMNGMLEGNGRTAQTWVPALDVWETPTEVVYAFDLPGIPEDQISIEVKDDNLTVSGREGRRDERERLLPLRASLRDIRTRGWTAPGLRPGQHFCSVSERGA